MRSVPLFNSGLLCFGLMEDQDQGQGGERSSSLQREWAQETDENILLLESIMPPNV